MIKLAILGAENSHAWQFAKALAPKEGAKMFDDVELLGFYTELDKEDGKIAVEKINEVSTCTFFADHYNDFLEEADAVMVTARHGANHLKYAKSYIEKGIPVWLDKPITCSPAEVEEVIALAAKYNAPLGGGSSLIHTDAVKNSAAFVGENRDKVLGGHVTAPIMLDSPYGGFWFYAQHLVQMVTEVFGTDIKSVKAFRDKVGVSVVYSYEDFNVSGYFGTDYGIDIYLSEGFAMRRETVNLEGDFCTPELKEFYDIIKSGKSPLDMKKYAAPVYIIDATVRAYETGTEVSL